LLSAFFGVDDDPATYGLAASIDATMPYLSNEISRPVAFDETHIEWLVLHIHKWCSLYDVTAGVLAERLENVTGFHLLVDEANVLPNPDD
jgi:hypothetical protein